MIIIKIRKVVVVTVLLLFSSITIAENIDKAFLSGSSVYKVYVQCEANIDEAQVCLDYFYYLGKESKLVAVFNYRPIDELEEKNIPIENAMEKLMMLLLSHLNPEASKILGVKDVDIERNFNVNPYRLEDVTIGLTSRYENKSYSGYFRVVGEENKRFRFKIRNTDKTPVKMLEEDYIFRSQMQEYKQN
ncbi:hypothetical protein [Vibrio sp. HN007]|uniref:hypothetical protein n=1 Tax=Vibrio iocasae TaxID=3098914 RepID=UPI0035D4524D